MRSTGAGQTRPYLISWLLIAGLVAIGRPAMAAADAVVESLPGAVRVACVGDSITYGYGVPLRERNCYPARLQVLLGPAYQVGNFGSSGATLMKRGNSPYWKTEVFQKAQAFGPQIVIIMLGTNDAKQNNWEHHETFVADYQELVGVFQRLPTKPTVLVALTAAALKGAGFGISPAAVQAQLPAIRELGQRLGLPVIDLNSPLQERRELFVRDGVHPNASGDEVIAQTVYRALQEQGLTKAQAARVHVRHQSEMPFAKAAGFRDGPLGGQKGWQAGKPFVLSAAGDGLQVASEPADSQALLASPSAPAAAGQTMVQLRADFQFATASNAPLKGFGVVFAVQLARTSEGLDPIRLQLVRWAGGKPLGNLYTLRLIHAGGSVQSGFIEGDALGMSQGLESERLQLRLTLYRQPTAPNWMASGYLVNLTAGSTISALQNQPVVSTGPFHAAAEWYGGLNNGGPFGLTFLRVDAFSLGLGDWQEPAPEARGGR